MSAQDKRRALLAFGALAAVLIVAVIVLWPPPYFDKSGATGAIGAVEKHRAPQITPQDVILGDEATRREQKVAYVDYFDDAAKLRAISASLGVQAAARSTVDAAAKDLESLTAEMQNEFRENAESALGLISQILGRKAGADQLESEVAELSAMLGKVSMQDFSNRLASVAQQVESQAALEVESLENAENLLNKAVAQLKAKDNKSVAEAASTLESAARELQVRAAAANHTDYAEYASAMAVELRKLDGARDSLAAASRLENEEEIAAKARNVSEALAKEAAALEAQGLENMQERLDARFTRANKLQIIAVLIGLNREQIASSVQDGTSNTLFSEAMQNVSQNFENRRQEFEAAATLGIESELAALSRQLDARDQLRVKGVNASSALGLQIGDMVDLTGHLERLNRAVTGKSALALSIDNQALEARAGELRNRAYVLQGGGLQ